MQRYQQIRKALGSEAVLTIIVSGSKAAEALFIDLWQQIDDFEARFSRFQPTSELSKVNLAAGNTVEISQAMKEILHTSLTYNRLTKGVFNPFVLPALQKAGYKGSWPSPQSFNPTLDMSTRQVHSLNELELIDNTLWLPNESALDFGGIGKGYLLDLLADWLTQKTIHNFWLSLGGDIICAGYDLDDHQQPTKDWRISIAGATEGLAVATVQNLHGERLAIATSGITKRKGDDWNHIIDPSTGKSVETNILHVTALSKSATAADVYAKVMLINPKLALPESGAHALLGKVTQDNNNQIHIIDRGGRLDTSHNS